MAPCFWRRHRGTALRSLLLLALLHRLNCLAFLAACAPVLLLTAFLLGVVLLHSDVVPLSASAEEEVDRHLYKKIRRHRIIISSEDESPTSSSSSEQDEEEEEHLVAEQEGNKAAVAWTADDESSIQSIGSLELERDARLEKLVMSRRSSSLQRRNLDVRIPGGGHSYYDKDDPGSAPSSLLQLRHPFFHADATNDVQLGDDEPPLLTRHESFTAPLARPSRFRPYFVTDDPPPYFDKAAILDNSKNKMSTSPSSPSSSSSAASDHQQTLLVMAQEQEETAAPLPSPCKKWDGMSVDVELISDSSDDDMSLPGDDPAASVSIMTREHTDDEEEDSFEVASITQQVAAGHHHQLQTRDEAQPQPQSMASVHPSLSGHQQQHHALPEVEKEKEVYDIREHHALAPVPAVVDSSSSSAAGAGAGAGAAGAGKGAAGARAAGAAGGSSKSSTKFKAPSKKAVFGFFRK